MQTALQRRFAKRLKQLRLAQGLSAEALARRVGFSLGYIQRLESGSHHDVPLSTLGRLAKGLKVTVAELLS